MRRLGSFFWGGNVPPARRRHRLQGIRIVAYVLFVLAFYLIPLSFFEAHPFCVYYNLLGIRCPTCGMTRALACIFRLRFADAFWYNRMAPLFFGFFLVVSASDALSFILRFMGKDCGNLAEWILAKVFPGALASAPKKNKKGES